MKIAIQGYSGSFHAIAARRLFTQDADLLYYTTFKEVFKALERGQADRAVVAIENSLYGSINEVYDLLLKNNFWISGEVYEHIGLHLLALAGAKLEDITDVYSQAPALAEAEDFLDTTLSKADKHEFVDTALAAKAIADWKDSTKAAVAGVAAAQEYDLEILSKNIETHHENYTRFIALSRDQQTLAENNKTTITFRTSDTPGSLYAALGVFAKRSINLSKLESRPIVGSAWKYMYYVDFEANCSDDLIEELSNYATEIRVLGSYKSGAFESI